jgi:hypothetical protein
MPTKIPDRPEDFNGDLKTWFNWSFDEFEWTWKTLKEEGRTAELPPCLREFERRMWMAAKAGVEEYYVYATVAQAATLPRSRLAYFARAYELLLEESKVPRYDEMPCCVSHHYQLADYAHEMGRIHEGEGDLKAAAALYQCSLQHLQEGADACDAHLNDANPDVPRRPGYTESLERVKKFLR